MTYAVKSTHEAAIHGCRLELRTGLRNGSSFETNLIRGWAPRQILSWRILRKVGIPIASKASYTAICLKSIQGMSGCAYFRCRIKPMHLILSGRVQLSIA